MIDTACLLLIGYFVVPDWTGEWASLRAEAIGAMALVLAHLVTLIVLVRRHWVRMAAEAYAIQLLAACDTLAAKGGAS